MALATQRLGRNVIVLAAVSGLTDVSSEMIYPLLPLFLSGVLGASATSIGAIEGAAESVAALVKLGSGWWSDRLRRRKPLVVLGYALASVVRPLVGLATSAGQVLAIRLADRFGKGVRTAPRDALIADSVDASIRGRAFGVHRAGDHLGAAIGPLAAFALLSAGLGMRDVFLLAAVPAALSVALLVAGVREQPPATPAVTSAPAATSASDLSVRLPRRFWGFLGVLLLFTLGSSTDAFLLLRAAELGVPVALIPVLWALLHVVKSSSSVVGGGLSDRIGRRPLLIGGWLVYAATYAAFGAASEAWHAWALFALYGTYFGLVEGAEKALVADFVPAHRRGAAYGWHALAVGLGALPASLIFGLLWDGFGAPTAFGFGAALALAAAALLALVRPPSPDYS